MLLAVWTGCGERSDRTATETHFATAWDIRVEQGNGTSWCPAGLATVVALVTGPWRFEPGARPRLHVVVGCERVGRCVDVHAGVALVVTSPVEPEALFEGASIQRAGCARWPLSVALVTFGTVRAVHEAVGMAHEQYRVLHASDQEVLDWLRAGVPRGAFLQAIVVAGDRRMRAAVPLLLRYLDSEDSDVVMRAVGALGRIGDEAALRPLGRLALAMMPEVPHAALQAIADIGGGEAIRVLEVVAAQAQSPVIVREARDLIRRLGQGREDE